MKSLSPPSLNPTVLDFITNIFAYIAIAGLLSEAVNNAQAIMLMTQTWTHMQIIWRAG